MPGKYAPLENYLRGLPIRQREVTMSFEQIEGILNDSLPLSATNHRAWWSNGTDSRVEAHAWLNAGWKVDSVNSNKKWVRFRREK
jgi:hypothetical protein